MHPEVSTPNSPLFLNVDMKRIIFRYRLTGKFSVIFVLNAELLQRFRIYCVTVWL